MTLLSDDHAGGDLIVGGDTIPLTLGAVVCFRADALHRVTEVTDGVRWSMVGWAELR